jgi:membrane protein involved in colicin uptake
MHVQLAEAKKKLKAELAAAKEKQRQEREAAKEDEAEKVHEESLAMLAKERAQAKGAAKSGAAQAGDDGGGSSAAAGADACRISIHNVQLSRPLFVGLLSQAFANHPRLTVQ